MALPISIRGKRTVQESLLQLVDHARQPDFPETNTSNSHKRSSPHGTVHGQTSDASLDVLRPSSAAGACRCSARAFPVTRVVGHSSTCRWELLPSVDAAKGAASPFPVSKRRSLTLPEDAVDAMARQTFWKSNSSIVACLDKDSSPCLFSRPGVLLGLKCYQDTAGTMRRHMDQPAPAPAIIPRMTTDCLV